MKKAKSAPETAPEKKVEETPKPAKPKTSQTVNKVGSLLKEMRQQKGLRLPDVSKRLCIRKFYLEAIEESRYADIPAFPYGVGFIRSYAEYLGLNSSNIVELYKEETNTAEDKNIYVLEPQAEATVPNRKYLVISLLALILVYVLWAYYNNRDNQETSPVEDVVTEEEVGDDSQPIVVEDFSVVSEVAEPAASAETAPVPSDEQIVMTDAKFEEPLPAAKITPVPASAVETEPEAEPATKPTAPTPVTTPTVEQIPTEGVALKITAETWIEVKDENKLYISKVLYPGTIYVVPENGRGMLLSVGNTDGVEIYVNGAKTEVVRPNKKLNIELDPFLNAAAH